MVALEYVAGKTPPKSTLADVLPDRGFHFHTGISIQTGKFAKNLIHFSRFLEQIEGRSIKFHLAKKDLELGRILGGDARSLKLTKGRRILAVEKLRVEILKVVRGRFG